MKTKAAILSELNKPLDIEIIETPELKEGQVLVKILYAGLCHTQVNEIKGFKGEDKFLPHLLGHEASGIVEEIGEGVTKVSKGDFVVLSWIKGLGLDCPSAKYQGEKKEINSGAISVFSNYAVISENRVFKIPKEVPPEVAALLGCAIPTGAGIIKNHVTESKGKTIAIFGLGGIGSSALLYAKTLEFTKIIAVDIHNSKLEFAKKLGATDIINSKEKNVIEKIKDLTEHKGVDYAIECSGVKTVMEQAFESLNFKGLAIIAGNLRAGETISIDPFQLIVGKQIIGTWGGKTNPDEDILLYAKKYLDGNFMLEQLITKIFSLENIDDAVEALENGEVIRALIKLN